MRAPAALDTRPDPLDLAAERWERACRSHEWACRQLARLLERQAACPERAQRVERDQAGLDVSPTVIEIERACRGLAGATVRRIEAERAYARARE